MRENRLDLFRRALADLGDASPERLVEHCRQRYGLTIEPRMVPIYRASLRDLENLVRLRQERPAAPD